MNCTGVASRNCTHAGKHPVLAKQVAQHGQHQGADSASPTATGKKPAQGGASSGASVASAARGS